MCGRTACTLDPEALTKACRYKDRNGHERQPQWKNNDSSKYFPSYNISPQSYTPVMISSQKETLDCESPRQLQPMRFGLVPGWFKGDLVSFSLKMHNARIESITEKKSFKVCLEKGQRCVVLAEGFYEWKETQGSGTKQPYFIYFNKNVEHEENDDEKDEMTSARPLLTMAGIFDVCQCSLKEEPLYSYSVITLEAKHPFKSIHHRVPAILKDDEAVRQWLDSREVNYEKALKLLSPVDCLAWHPVSKAVNNSRYKEVDCIKEIDLSLAEKQAEKSKITNWFLPKRKEQSSESNEEPQFKKEKTR